MSDKDRIKWNTKHSKRFGESAPSKIVTDYYTLAPPGNALDMAAGKGRNSIFLANKGFAVDAVDVSSVAIDQLKGKHPKINPICEDLDTWEIPQNHYQLIANIRFLDQRLFSQMQDALKPGGVLIFQSYIQGTQKSTKSPHCRKYLLRQNELLHGFLQLNIVFYEEKIEVSANEILSIASLVAIKKG